MSNPNFDPDSDMTGGSGLGLGSGVGSDVLISGNGIAREYGAVEPSLESSVEEGTTEPPKEPEFDERFYNEMVCHPMLRILYSSLYAYP